MNNIIDLAIAYWRLEKWVAAAPVERKMAAESSLRTFQEFLNENKLKVIDLTGQPYDQGLSVEVMYYEDEDSDDDKTPTITEMMSPIIIQDGNVIKFGQIVIAKNPQISDVVDDESIAKTDVPEIDLPKDADFDYTSTINKRPYLFYRIAFVACSVLLICGLVYGSIALKKINDNLIKATDERTTLQHQIDIITKNQESIMQEKDVETKEDTLEWKAYIVKKDDSLVSICNQNNINYDAWKQIIISTNNISDVDKILEGQTILIPIVNTND